MLPCFPSLNQLLVLHVQWSRRTCLLQHMLRTLIPLPLRFTAVEIVGIIITILADPLDHQPEAQGVLALRVVLDRRHLLLVIMTMTLVVTIEAAVVQL